MSERTAIVTGGNRGLGLETCRQLAAAGWRVVLASRDARKGQAAAKRLGDSGVVESAQLDVGDAASVRAFAERARTEWPRVDALVNNAGMSMKGFDGDVARTTVDVNTFGAMRVTDALLPLVPEDGAVVMVSSGMGEVSCLSPELRARFLAPDLSREELTRLLEQFVRDVAEGRHAARGWPSSAYSVSKVGMNAYVRVLARDLLAAGRHVHVNAVSPGWVKTDMGGRGAPRSVEEGASGIVWAATLPPDGPTGGFFVDAHAVAW